MRLWSFLPLAFGLRLSPSLSLSVSLPESLSRPNRETQQRFFFSQKHLLFVFFQNGIKFIFSFLKSKLCFCARFNFFSAVAKNMPKIFRHLSCFCPTFFMLFSPGGTGEYYYRNFSPFFAGQIRRQIHELSHFCHTFLMFFQSFVPTSPAMARRLPRQPNVSENGFTLSENGPKFP